MANQGYCTGTFISCYTDADWAGDKDNGGSKSGCTLFLNRVPISWRFKSKKAAVLSSAQAEFVAASEAAKNRRNQAAASNQKNDEFNTTMRVEKDVTARMQRLAATKRNAKKGKYK